VKEIRSARNRFLNTVKGAGEEEEIVSLNTNKSSSSRFLNTVKGVGFRVWGLGFGVQMSEKD
jgi:hypothetical protein